MRRRTLAALAALLVLASSGTAGASPDEAIVPLEQYTTATAKSLAARYRDHLVQFYQQIYSCLPWVGVPKNGIGFRQPRGAGAEERYLSVWIAIDQTEDGAFAALPRDRRVSAMFSRYGVDMLRRMARLSEVAADSSVQGFGVVLSWLKPGSAGRAGVQPVTETLALFIDTASLHEFLANRLPASEFADRARFTVFDGKDTVGRVPLEIWEDSFNSTYRLPNYEPPKGVRCN
jgi:hypothetical protein